MSGLLEILDWLVEHERTGIAVAVAVAAGVILLAGVVMRAWRRGHGDTLTANRSGKVQQTNVRGVRAGRDVNVKPDQD